MEIVPTLRYFLSTEIAADKRADIEKIDPGEDLLDQGVVDSLVLIRLVSYIEEKFCVKVFDEEISKENFRDLNSIKDFIERKLSSQLGSANV